MTSFEDNEGGDNSNPKVLSTVTSLGSARFSISRQTLMLTKQKKCNEGRSSIDETVNLEIPAQHILSMVSYSIYGSPLLGWFQAAGT